jgi:hypothetical protein
MKRRVSIAMIVVGVGLMIVAFSLTVTQHADESTMYWFGLGGLLAVIGIGAIQRR